MPYHPGHLNGLAIYYSPFIPRMEGFYTFPGIYGQNVINWGRFPDNNMSTMRPLSMRTLSGVFADASTNLHHYEGFNRELAQLMTHGVEGRTRAETRRNEQELERIIEGLRAYDIPVPAPAHMLADFDSAMLN
jgi:hypothetical protein